MKESDSFPLTITYNLNESRPSIVMLLQTVLNGTLVFYIKFGDSEHKGTLNAKLTLQNNF